MKLVNEEFIFILYTIGIKKIEENKLNYSIPIFEIILITITFRNIIILTHKQQSSLKSSYSFHKDQTINQFNTQRMLRATKKSDSPSFNSSTLSTSMFSETTTETMSREIDNYTRRLEQDKRKFFRAQQNYSQVKKQYDNKNKQLQKLKSKQHKNQLNNLKNQIIGLEANLDQNINSYNQSLAKNNKLRCQIDELRKQKKTENLKLLQLTDLLDKLNTEIQLKQSQIQQRKLVIQKNKEMIIQAKQTNQMELKQHQIEVKIIKSTFDQTGKQQGRKNKDQSSGKPQTIDTQPLLRLRLKNIIAQNKEKIKIIEQYRRNMHTIYQNFEEIKQQSGIQQLQEITKTFLKQQDQNTFIYQYMNRLNVGIQSLRETNDELKRKLQEQRQINAERRMKLAGTPQEAKRRQDYQRYKDQKMKSINQFKAILDEINPKLHEVLIQYNLIDPQQQFELTQSTVTQYISMLQDLLHNSPLNLQSSTNRQQIKDDITRYTKLPPSVLDDIKEKPEERLLEKEKLNEIAGEYWQKKRPNKMPSSGKVNQ